MICTACGMHNEHGKFCGHCGAPLPTEVNENLTHSTEKDKSVKDSVTDGWNKIKQSDAYKQGISISKQYGSYFIQTIKAPSKAAKLVTSAHVINAIISIILTSLFIPLTTYFLAGKYTFGGSVPFGSFVIKPFALILISFAISSGVAFAMLRLARVKTDYLTVLSKIGVLFVLALATFIISTLSAVIGLSYSFTMIFFSLGLFTLIIAHAHILLTARKENEGGFDLIYGTIITVVVLMYVLSKAAQVGVQGILGNFF